MGWIVPVAWQGTIPKIFLSLKILSSVKVAETEHGEKCGHIALLLYHSPSLLFTHPPKTDFLSYPCSIHPHPHPKACAHHHQHQVKPQAMLPNTPRGYATSFPGRVGRVEVEPGEGLGPRRSWLSCLLACWSDRSGPRGRGQGCPFISALQCCTRHPLASSLNRRKEEAATGARGGVGVILGSRA